MPENVITQRTLATCSGCGRGFEQQHNEIHHTCHECRVCSGCGGGFLVHYHQLGMTHTEIRCLTCLHYRKVERASDA